MYVKPKLHKALGAYEAIAADESCSKTELANRWVAWSPALGAELGDAIIIGSHVDARLRANIKGIRKGPPSAVAMKEIEEIRKLIEHDAPINYFDQS
jgi:aryl-alcohol dehydrogenase-like predicted oxidoreductase